jgi:hypothetical protein
MVCGSCAGRRKDYGMPIRTLARAAEAYAEAVRSLDPQRIMEAEKALHEAAVEFANAGQTKDWEKGKTK